MPIRAPAIKASPVYAVLWTWMFFLLVYDRSAFTYSR